MVEAVQLHSGWEVHVSATCSSLSRLRKELQQLCRPEAAADMNSFYYYPGKLVFWKQDICLQAENAKSC